MSLSSSPPSFSPSRTLQPSARMSLRNGLTLDELIDRMRAVPDPVVPLIPTEHYNNSYFGFLAEFRRAVRAAIPGARKYQNAITKEAGRRWRQCDELAKMHWTMLADASIVFMKKPNGKRVGGSPRAHTHKAYRASESSRRQSLRWNPYSPPPKFSTASSKSHPESNMSFAPLPALLPPSQAVFDSTLPVHSAWDMIPAAWDQTPVLQAPIVCTSYEYGAGDVFVDRAPLPSYALDALQDDFTATGILGAYAPRDVRLNHDWSLLGVCTDSAASSRSSPRSFEVSPSHALSHGSSLTPQDRIFDDLNVEMPTPGLFHEEFLNSLCLEFCGLQSA